MAKNITIREGDTAKQFTAKKLKMNLVGGGTANFVPEDEVLDYVDLKDHTFNQSGTFNPSQFNCDGFRQVKIDIPADVKEKTITANGEYNAGDDNVLGYSKVTVAVPGGGGGGPFTVLFLDQNNNVLEKVDNVPYGGGAVYHGTNPTMNGMRFVGWNPAPYGVKQNLNCYPRFENISYSPDQIVDDWITLANNIQADADYYPTGMWKTLELQDGTLVKMQLVAKNVDKLQGNTGYAHTTWVAMTVFDISFNPSGYGSGYYTTTEWETDALRAYLQTTFLQDKFPQELIPYLKTIIKYTSGYNMDSGMRFTDYPTLENIWIPSRKETIDAGETLGTFYDVAFGVDGQPDQNARRKPYYNGNYNLQYPTRTGKQHGYYFSNRQTYGYVCSSGAETNFSPSNASSGFPYIIGFCL